MEWQELLTENWHVKLVCLALILAAYIDGKQLRVPNWLTYPMVLTGLIFGAWSGGWGDVHSGFLGSLLGMFVGLACLLPLYAVGGMGAGDVKLMAGVGAWLGIQTTFYAFCVSAIVGAVMAVVMVWRSRDIRKHWQNLMVILLEWMHVRDPRELSRIAAKRKPNMLLLPYGIPICIGSIGYFLYTGML
ncbi:MAG: prepilin peptidase [Planctomycetes bacterium]|nr:prepilin peptidase [Planctomycetota bacterium]